MNLRFSLLYDSAVLLPVFQKRKIANQYAKMHRLAGWPAGGARCGSGHGWSKPTPAGWLEPASRTGFFSLRVKKCWAIHLFVVLSA